MARLGCGIRLRVHESIIIAICQILARTEQGKSYTLRGRQRKSEHLQGQRHPQEIWTLRWRDNWFQSYLEQVAVMDRHRLKGVSMEFCIQVPFAMDELQHHD